MARADALRAWRRASAPIVLAILVSCVAQAAGPAQPAREQPAAPTVADRASDARMAPPSRTIPARHRIHYRPTPRVPGPQTTRLALGTVDAAVDHESLVSHLPAAAADRAWEPVVATHPTDPGRVAVVYQHRKRGAGCATHAVVRISSDAGRTWRTAPGSPRAGSPRGMGLHAAIAWGTGPAGEARLYWANMTSPACGGGRFSLSTTFSDDEGATWAPLRTEDRTPPWVGGFPDIAVDRNPASPNHGVVYVAYNWVDAGARGPGLRLLASADFGATWAAVEVPPVEPVPGHGDWWRIAYRLRTAPDGSIFVSWYQVDLRRWDPASILAKGGAGNVGRLAVAVARVSFDRGTGSLEVGRPRIAATGAETPFTTSGASAEGTAGQLRPDPMWVHGFDVDPATGRLYVAVAEFGGHDGGPRGSITVGRSDDGGETWVLGPVPAPPLRAGVPQSSLRPNLLAGPGYVLVTFRTLDDRPVGATVGSAYALSTNSGVTWRVPQSVSEDTWRPADLGGVVNGVGLRERAELLADGAVFWSYGDARHASADAPGRVAIYGAHLILEPVEFGAVPRLSARAPG